MEERFDEEELKFARQMKNDYCCKISNGKFQESQPDKAAEILHKIGLIYKRRSPDKISLIQSVGLLNAAIFRNPSNVSEIKRDLSEVIRHILTQANATTQNVDLIKKATSVKQSINELRKEVNQALSNCPAIVQNVQNKAKHFGTLSNFVLKRQNAKKFDKTKKINQINNLIAQKYNTIMADLSQFCEDVMGKPPCEYAIAGMGSLARNEITPYSDFEHIILLGDHINQKSDLEYFRWYSVIFHTVLLNLQETIIPSLNIYSLNDKDSELGDWYFDAYTPRGISFDGMMPHACKFPLGRTKHTEAKPFETELIKPVSKMLEYLSSKADLKNGYHLADILTKTCFVFGNADIFNHFQSGVENCLSSKSKQQRIDEVKQQVRDDLDNFSARFRLTQLKKHDTINIKQFVYRSSTIFISALARIHNISKNSCFDIINEMAKHEIITQNAKNKISFAIAIACEMRLRVYAENKSQCDTIKQDGEIIETFLNIVGAASTINYFQIAYCLQCEVAKQLNFTKFHFYSDPQLINFRIGLAFGMTGLAESFTFDQMKILWNLNEFNFDVCIEQLENTIDVDYVKDKKDNILNINLLKSLADHLKSTKIPDEALEFYQQLLTEEYTKKSSNKSNTEDIAWTYIDIGNCSDDLQQSQKALAYHQKALEIFISLTQNRNEDRNISVALNNIGTCLMDMQQYDDALIHLKQSLEIYRNISLDERNNGNVAMTLNNIGGCLKGMQQYDDALIHFKQSLEIKKNISLDERKDRNVASTLNNIGLCLMDMQQYDDALIDLKQSLEIYKNISLDERNDSNMAMTLNNIGNCLMKMHQYDDALIHFKQSLEIKKNISLDEQKDGNVAITLNNIGNCLRNIHQYIDALIHLTQSLKIYKNISLDERNDGNVAMTLNNIGSCLKNMQQYEDALIHLKQSLEITKRISLDERNDGDVAGTLNNIGNCLLDMQQYDDALIHLKQSLEITKRISLDERNDRNVAMKLNDIGSCLMDMHQYDDALIHLQQSLDIMKNISRDERNDGNVALTLNNIGNCLRNMQQYDEALLHLKQSLEIKNNISLDERNDVNVALTLYNTGLCFSDMHQYDDALIYLMQSLEIFQNISLDERNDGNVALILNNIRLCLVGD